jgi:hypothetical protein
MSYSDQPGYGSPKMIGCALIGLAGCFVPAMLLVGAAMGHCATDADGTGCENDGLIKFLMFPGSLIVLVMIGLFAAWRVTRDRD